MIWNNSKDLHTLGTRASTQWVLSEWDHLAWPADEKHVVAASAWDSHFVLLLHH
jgi:hypothetical protein